MTDSHSDPPLRVITFGGGKAPDLPTPMPSSTKRKQDKVSKSSYLRGVTPPQKESSKASPPITTTNRRSTHPRATPPVELWRGEKSDIGSNDFDSPMRSVDKGAFLGIRNKETKNARLAKNDNATVDGIVKIRDIRFEQLRNTKIIAAAPTESDFEVTRGRSLMFTMKNDMKDHRFEHPGYKVESRLVPPKFSLRFMVTMDLRIGTIIKAEPGALELRYGEVENLATFDISACDKFLIPPGEPVYLANRSKTNWGILIFVTIYGFPNSKKKAKLLDSPAPTQSNVDAEQELDFERGGSYNGNEVVSYGKQAMKYHRTMPLPPTRKASEGFVVGKSWDSFHKDDIGYNALITDFAAGGLLLPPKGIKDAETLVVFSQVYIVLKGQAKSVELSIGDPNDSSDDRSVGRMDVKTAKNFFLSSGDVFIIPPCNYFRIENHSISTECVLAWVLIRTIPSTAALDIFRRTLSTIRE